ncbi:MAG: fused MFS/spermidine synthase [Chloroflexota bacterium]|nr:fused MFS/spermidine synthase [Chloroflexota bacterium]
MTEPTAPSLSVANPSSAAPEPRSRPAIDSASTATAARSIPLLRLIVFIGGFSSIGVELTASRLIAPYFGSSTFIWATIIGLTLTFLAIGYSLGGRIADRRPSPRLLYSITAVAAIVIGLIPSAAQPILGASLAAFARYDVGAFYGSLIGVLLLLAIPVTMLGFVSPFAIRLRLASVSAAGITAGNTYTLSTVGSIMGSFVPVLVLIPLLGTNRTFTTISLALLIPSVIGLLLLRAVVPALVLAALFALVPLVTAVSATETIRPAERGQILDERESSYNYIQVVEDDGSVYLVLNEGHAIHSIYNPDELLTGGPWDYFMVAPLFVDGATPGSVENALLIGLAGGTVARQLTAAYGPIPIDGVEIDPEIAEVGNRFFGLDELANVNVIVADGRYALKTSDQRYDLIGIDAYRQPYIPFQLTSREFFREVGDHLTSDGVAVVNAGRTASDFRLVDVIASTMREVFAHVYIIDVDRYTNSIVVGTNAPAAIASFAQNLAAHEVDSPIGIVGQLSLDTGNIREVAPGGQVFTDDHAPVELVVDQIIVDVALDGVSP